MYIKVRVKTRMKKESFVQKTKDHFDVCVKEKPEKNMANKRVLELVAEHFDVSVKAVKIINGHHSPSKLLSVQTE